MNWKMRTLIQPELCPIDPIGNRFAAGTKVGPDSAMAFISYKKYVILAEAMLKPRHTNLLLIGLILLLGVQLTGLTCLGEWQVVNYSAQAELVSDSPFPEGNVLDHGCPCHFVFQSVFLSIPDNRSPHTDDVRSRPTLYVLTFVVSLFHPPRSI